MARPKNHDRGWRDWYQLQRWRNRAKHQLQVEPLCRFCLEQGRTTPATICDHIEPHGGDPNKFWLGALQSLCWSCHSGAKQQADRLGYRTDIGADGMPTDARHPIHRSGP